MLNGFFAYGKNAYLRTPAAGYGRRGKINTPRVPFVGVAIAQYPVYGMILDWARSAGIFKTRFMGGHSASTCYSWSSRSFSPTPHLRREPFRQTFRGAVPAGAHRECGWKCSSFDIPTDRIRTWALRQHARPDVARVAGGWSGRQRRAEVDGNAAADPGRIMQVGAILVHIITVDAA